jgi:hypothetical protein
VPLSAIARSLPAFVGYRSTARSGVSRRSSGRSLRTRESSRGCLPSHACIHEKRNRRGVNDRELLADTSALTSHVPGLDLLGLARGRFLRRHVVVDGPELGWWRRRGADGLRGRP